MEQRNDQNTGAPSTDTTSALFVSARKKQIEQQEAERLAKEREAERLAAEAEVHRLEQEVQARKMRAQEEAQRVERESAERLRQAELDAQRAEKDAAERHKQAQQKQFTQPEAPREKSSAPGAPSAVNGVMAKVKALGPKTLMLIGGGALVLILAIVLIATLSGGGGKAASSVKFAGEISSNDGLTASYPANWEVDTLLAGGAGLFMKGDDGLTALAVMDMTDGLNSMVAAGTDAVTAAEGLLYDVAGVFASGSAVTDMEPSLTKSGSTVKGSSTFAFKKGGVTMQGLARVEAMGDARTILTAYAVPDGSGKMAAQCEAILSSLLIGDPGDTGYAQDPAQGPAGSDAASGYDPYWETDARFIFYENSAAGLRCYIPEKYAGYDDYDNDAIGIQALSFDNILVLADFSSSYYNIVVSEGLKLNDLAYSFVSYLEDEKAIKASDISVSPVYTDVTGMDRVDATFNIGSIHCAFILRASYEASACVLAMTDMLDDETFEYLDVLATSASIAVG